MVTRLTMMGGVLSCALTLISTLQFSDQEGDSRLGIVNSTAKTAIPTTAENQPRQFSNNAIQIGVPATSPRMPAKSFRRVTVGGGPVANFSPSYSAPKKVSPEQALIATLPKYLANPRVLFRASYDLPQECSAALDEWLGTTELNPERKMTESTLVVTATNEIQFALSQLISEFYPTTSEANAKDQKVEEAANGLMQIKTQHRRTIRFQTPQQKDVELAEADLESEISAAELGYADSAKSIRALIRVDYMLTRESADAFAKFIKQLPGERVETKISEIKVPDAAKATNLNSLGAMSKKSGSTVPCYVTVTCDLRAQKKIGALMSRLGQSK